MIAQGVRAGGPRRSVAHDDRGWGRVIGTTLVGAGAGAVLGFVALSDLCVFGECSAPTTGERFAFAGIGAAGGALITGVPAVLAHEGVQPVWVGAGAAALGALGSAGRGTDAVAIAAAGGFVVPFVAAYVNRRER